MKHIKLYAKVLVGPFKAQGFMDYLQLKKTLMAVFDHFLSCHDKSELEEMMQAFEAGKSLVIKLPEAVDREDYRDDVNRMNMAPPKPKKVVSRVRRKKPKAPEKMMLKTQKQHICNVPILIDLTSLSKQKRQALKDALNGDYDVTLSHVTIGDQHGTAKAHISKTIQHQTISNDGFYAHHKNSSSDDYFYRNMDVKKSDEEIRQNLIEKITAEIKKYRDPP